MLGRSKLNIKGREYGIDFWQGLQILHVGFLFQRL